MEKLRKKTISTQKYDGVFCTLLIRLRVQGYRKKWDMTIGGRRVT